MPAAAVKGAIIVVTVVAAAAIAVYESPEVRQFAEQCRRRIAIALHSLGDEINPRSLDSEYQEPRYNRPEDAEGFLQSTAETGVDADETSRRRQREELMYWNQLRLEKLEKENHRHQNVDKNRTRGSSFDDFLHEDTTAEKGTYIYNSSAEVYDAEDGLVRRRQRRLDSQSPSVNPFADENRIEIEEQRDIDHNLMSPEQSETSEDLYSATDEIKPSPLRSHTLHHESQQELVDLSGTPFPSHDLPAELVSEPVSYPTIQELPTNSYYQDRYMPPSPDAAEAYASIHAWADNNTTSHGHDPSFYSPLPTSPVASLSVQSELEEILGGQATPTTDSASFAGSADDLGRDDASIGDDVLSVDGDGIITPGSWTEVGSIVSESDAGHEEAI